MVVVRAILIVLVVGAGIALVASGVLQRAATGTTVADNGTVLLQQAAAARDIGRGYDQAVDQIRKARALKLAISAQEVDAIATKALTDLVTLRHSALLSLSQTTGSSTDDAAAYAKSTEQQMDAARDMPLASGTPVASSSPVLLAPRLYAIVSRFNQLASTISDRATADLTRSPTPSPSRQPTPTPTPTR